MGSLTWGMVKQKWNLRKISRFIFGLILLSGIIIFSGVLYWRMPLVWQVFLRATFFWIVIYSIIIWIDKAFDFIDPGQSTFTELVASIFVRDSKMGGSRMLRIVLAGVAFLFIPVKSDWLKSNIDLRPIERIRYEVGKKSPLDKTSVSNIVVFDFKGDDTRTFSDQCCRELKFITMAPEIKHQVYGIKVIGNSLVETEESGLKSEVLKGIEPLNAVLALWGEYFQKFVYVRIQRLSEVTTPSAAGKIGEYPKISEYYCPTEQQEYLDVPEAMLQAVKSDLLLTLGKFDEATRAFEQLEKMGVIFDKPEIKIHNRKEMKRRHTNQALLGRGYSLLELGRYQEARSCFNEVIPKKQDITTWDIPELFAYFNKALLDYKTKNFKDAYNASKELEKVYDRFDTSTKQTIAKVIINSKKALQP